MAYSYIGEATEGKPVLYWGPHTAQSGMYFPIALRAAGTAADSQGGGGGIQGIPVPRCLSAGSIKAIDRGCAYWAFRRVKQSAMICWDRSLERIVERQVRTYLRTALGFCLQHS